MYINFGKLASLKCRIEYMIKRVGGGRGERGYSYMKVVYMCRPEFENGGLGSGKFQINLFEF